MPTHSGAYFTFAKVRKIIETNKYFYRNLLFSKHMLPFLVCIRISKRKTSLKNLAIS